ncbi:hypothetical protein QP157_08160 [Sphingomonas sp. LR61]|uniref:hypothetical protein n=1 Tax=Sphingomonas sp. LR61 TaxID=3050234 RepID=UPI002FDF3764
MTRAKTRIAGRAAEHDRHVDAGVLRARGRHRAQLVEALAVDGFTALDGTQRGGEHERDDLGVPASQPVVAVRSDAVQRRREQELLELRTPLVERQAEPLPREQHRRSVCVVALGRHRPSTVSARHLSCSTVT